MSMYTGTKCPVCDAEFTENDDVVICPECGTPHHRSCYNKNGQCINIDWHKEGKVWQTPINNDKNSNAKKNTSLSYVRCANCGTFNPDNISICGKCGTPLANNSIKIEDPEELENIKRLTDVLSEVFNTQENEKTTFDEKNEVSTADLADFVGQNNFSFLMKFNVIHSRNAYPFNWAAFLFGFPYFFYRKMYKIGAVVMAITLLSFVPSFIVSFNAVNEAMQSLVTQNLPVTIENLLLSMQNILPAMTVASPLITISNLLNFAIRIFCVMFFNRLYLKHCINKISKIRKTFGENVREKSPLTSSSFVQTLRVNGGVNPLSVILSIMIYYLIFVIISFVISFAMLLV